jgi:hypothetical protein
VVVALAAGLLLVGLTLLPHDRQLRFRDVGEDAAVAAWIYERIHVDPAPIDVAFFGSSHTLAAVHSEEIEAALAAGGFADLTVTSFGFPWHGRNIQYALVRELLRERRPDLLILEVRSIEGRLGHPVFAHLADATDIFEAFATGYDRMFLDVALLPQRQFRLFVRSRLGWLFGDDTVELSPRSTNYERHWFDAKEIVNSPETMEAAAARYKRGKRWHILPESLHAIEFYFPITYVKRIAGLAAAEGIPLAFLYLPFYGGPEQPRDAALYEELGQLWTPPAEILGDSSLWSDVTHHNLDGSFRMVPWLADRIEEALPQSNAGR